MKPIGVFGGTFDPIHWGHILPILDVCETLGFDQVRYIPNARPSHRGQPQTEIDHRWNMTVLALEEFSQLVADDREIQRPGKSFMVPTLRSLRSEFQWRPLSLILGLDAFLQLNTWYWWAEILRLSNIVVMNRPGAKIPKVLPVWWEQAINSHPRTLYERFCGNIVHVDVAQVDVSATRLRISMARGDDRNDWLPPAVAQYVNEHQLYSKKEVAV